MFTEQKTASNLTYYNFIIFEPSSLRIEEQDILAKGNQIVDINNESIEYLVKQNSMKESIILNRIKKIEMMLSLVKDFDNVIITKFINKIWRRYLYFSNLGETFLDINYFTNIFPEYKKNKNQIVAQRIIKNNNHSHNHDDDDSEEQRNKKENNPVSNSKAAETS
jgi:hypothetical protein